MGQMRGMRLTNEDWALLQQWAAELGQEAGVKITPSQIIRKLIDQERQRRGLVAAQ